MGNELAMPLRDDDLSAGCRGRRNLSGVRLERTLRGRQSGVPRTSDAPALLLVLLDPGACDPINRGAGARDAVECGARACDPVDCGTRAGDAIYFGAGARDAV